MASAEPFIATGTWNNAFCNPCATKGAGLMPCCIPNCVCCMCCTWASATSQIKGKEEWGSYPKCCILAGLCPCCVFAHAYYELAAHYKIKHDGQAAAIKFCLPLLSYYQLIDTIMVKEELHMININVEPDSLGGGPKGLTVMR